MRYTMLPLSIAVWSIATAAAVAAQRGFPLVALAPDNTLVLFDSGNPGATRIVRIRGLDAPLIGIDVRPLDRKLYGLTATDQLVTLALPSGMATRVSTLGTPFRGTEVSGFDFNPQADRLRLIGPGGRNLRVSVDVGAVAVDRTLAYARGDPAEGATPRVTAVAYTNSFANAPTTITFDLDSATNTLVRQDPPNDGVLHTVGALGVECGDVAGFDIVSPKPGIDDAFVVCGLTLYRANLVTGRLTSIGLIGANVERLLSLAALPGGAR